MLNRFEGIGRIGRDIELRYTQSGTPVTNFNVACDSGYGEKKRTEWVQVVVFGKTAELCNEYVGKGSLVYIAGPLQTRKWQDQDGMDRYTTEVLAHEVKFLSSGGGNRQRGEVFGQPREGVTEVNDNDDVPF